jgi:shikimate kinase
MAVTSILKGVNLYLVGMMGAGKSTVGRQLASRLGYHFFDTDALIEQATGQSVRQIFAESGEAIFRKLESQVLAQLCAQKNLLISTGGGIVTTPFNWSYLRHGIVVWLDVPIDTLYQRLQQDEGRPLLQTPDPLQTLTDLLVQRERLYAQADLRLTTQPAETPDQICDRLLTELPAILRPGPQILGEAASSDDLE